MFVSRIIGAICTLCVNLRHFGSKVRVSRISFCQMKFHDCINCANIYIYILGK